MHAKTNGAEKALSYLLSLSLNINVPHIEERGDIVFIADPVGVRVAPFACVMGGF